jgi:SAM-dependent methyltransferase
MKLITSIDEIRAFDERFREITESADLPICTGSIFLLSSDVLHRWEIGITPENEADIIVLAEEARLIEVSKREGFPILEKLARPKMREWLEPRMARYMADLTHDVASDMAKQKGIINICDLPSREGIVSGSLMMLADDELTKKLRFSLVDHSRESLEIARGHMRKKRKDRDSPEIIGECYCEIDTLFLDTLPEKTFDIILSLSHFHHKSFLKEFLQKIHRVLKDDGVLIMGDRHSSMLDHPYHSYQLLKAIGVRRPILQAFEDMFGKKNVTEGEGCRIEPEENEAIGLHKEYWVQIANNVRAAKLDSSVPRVSFLEAHDTSKARQKKLNDAGFTTDPGVIRRAFPNLARYTLPKRLTRGKNGISDFAVVMAAMKKPQG